MKQTQLSLYTVIERKGLKFKKGFLLGTIFLCFATSSFSQNLNLPDAINIALKNSLDIQLQRNNLAIAKINNYVGVAGGLPQVAATASDNEQLINVNQKLNTGQEIKRSAAPANHPPMPCTGLPTPAAARACTD